MDLFKFLDHYIFSSMHDTIILFSLKENNVGQCIYLKVSENKFLFPVLYGNDISLCQY
jgi:hypothetical protein